MRQRQITTLRRTARTDSGRRARDLRKAIGTEIRSQRTDSGLSQRRLAEAAGIDHAFLSQIEAGEREPSLSVLAAIADALGANLRLRLYPGTGPRLRDGIQARIGEALLAMVDPAWHRFVEVPVHRPVSGVIDVVLHDPDRNVIVATEIQSQLNRLEQQLRWCQLKAESIPSSDVWRFAGGGTRTDRLLVLRSTSTMRDLAVRFEQTLATAYPARTQDVLAALTTQAPWPGSGLLWADVDGDRVRIRGQPPRGVRLGR